MHEASLAGGVLQLVEDAARREGFTRLISLRLEAGELAGVDVRALRFALERGSRSGRVAWQFAKDWAGRSRSKRKPRTAARA